MSEREKRSPDAPLGQAPAERTENLLDWLYALRDRQRQQQRNGAWIIKGKDLPWEDNDQGRMQWYLHPAIEGTAIRRKGDRGRLMLPRWFVEQQGLPLNRHMSDREVEEWLAAIRLKAAAAQDYAEAHPEDPDAQIALERALNELSAAMLLRARRQGEPR